MILFQKKISRSQAKQSKAKWNFQNPKAKQSKVGFSKSRSKAKQSEISKIPKQSKAKQSGRQSKVSKVKAKQSSTPGMKPTNFRCAAKKGGISSVLKISKSPQIPQKVQFLKFLH